jgi:hypothetical protein
MNDFLKEKFQGKKNKYKKYSSPGFFFKKRTIFPQLIPFLEDSTEDILLRPS